MARRGQNLEDRVIIKMKNKIEWSKLLCTIIAIGFGIFAIWCGIEFYSLCRLAIELNSEMPDVTLAVTAMTTVIGALLSYLLYQMGLKNSRNKYGISEDGTPFASKADIEASIEELEEDY